uniref:hypothetical protein n=1 Tax=Prevotella sp. TaxID=59823 RepID=UPI004028C8D0
MKRTYIKPAVEILDIETKSTFMADSWHVRGKNTNPETDHGYIIEEGGEYPDNYNPWDSSNW